MKKLTSESTLDELLGLDDAAVDKDYCPEPEPLSPEEVAYYFKDILEIDNDTE
jgi:hypothetical protein